MTMQMQQVAVTLKYEDAVVLLTLMKGMLEIATNDSEAKLNGVSESIVNIVAAVKEAM